MKFLRREAVAITPRTSAGRVPGLGWFVDYWPYLSLLVGVAVAVGAVLNRGRIAEYENWFLFFALPVPILALHQFEEYVLPGGFRAWCNREVYHSPNVESPLSKTVALGVNFPLPQLAIAANAWLASYTPWIGLVPWFFALTNAYFHIAYTVAAGRYSPGFATSLLLMIPTAAMVSHFMIRERLASLPVFLLMFFLGIASHVILFRSIGLVGGKSLGGPS